MPSTGGPPFIAVSMGVVQGALPRSGINAAYLRAIESAGGIPIPVPPHISEATLEAVLQRCEGVLLTGGPDLTPQRYGQEPHPAVELQTLSTERDDLDLHLATTAVERNLPLLAICRGHQALNVALGGTLVQDIPSAFPNALQHRQSEPREAPTHAVTLESGSRLAAILGRHTVTTNTLHHQAIGDLGRGLVATGRTQDGVIEAVELPGARWLAGVQWHPEEMISADHAVALFRSFVDACR